MVGTFWKKNKHNSTRICNADGCDMPGVYRAPKMDGTSHPQIPNSWFWFCKEHVRSYNARWDYYRGMSEEEANASYINDRTWNRPTWPMGNWGQSRSALYEMQAEHHTEDPRYCSQNHQNADDFHSFNHDFTTPNGFPSDIRRQEATQFYDAQQKPQQTSVAPNMPTDYHPTHDFDKRDHGNFYSVSQNRAAEKNTRAGGYTNQKAHGEGRAAPNGRHECTTGRDHETYERNATARSQRPHTDDAASHNKQPPPQSKGQPPHTPPLGTERIIDYSTVIHGNFQRLQQRNTDDPYQSFHAHTQQSGQNDPYNSNTSNHGYYGNRSGAGKRARQQAYFDDYIHNNTRKKRLHRKDQAYLDLLGLNYPFSADQLQFAYRQMVKRFHPDLNRDNPKAEDLFKKITEGYNALKQLL